MNKLYAYFCPVCTHVEIVAIRRVGAYHTAPGIFRHARHAMLEAGVYDASRGLDAIKADVLARDWNSGVRDIPHESKELGAGVVLRWRGKRKAA